MFFSHGKTKEPEVKPQAPPPPQIQDLAIFGEDQLVLHGMRFEYTDEIRELMETLPIAEEKGLKNQAVQIKRRAIASALSQKKMGLVHDIWDDGHTIALFMPDGKEKSFINRADPSGKNRFTKLDLKSYQGDMPLDVIRNIPSELVNDADIFVPRWAEPTRKIDPVIVLRLTTTQNGYGGWYLGLYWWV